jgi:hypothetical protein
MKGRDLPTVFLTGLAGSIFAQVPDPTRPPAAAMDQEAGRVVAVAVESGVQAVVLRRGGKSAAVINGQYVEEGGKLGDKRVLKISESEVVLMGERGREVIKTIPAIEKVPTRKAIAAKPPMTGTTQK